MQSESSPGSRIIRVSVADRTRIHTQLLAEALSRDPRLQVIAASTDSPRLPALSEFSRVDVALISSDLEENPTRGFELLRELRAAWPALRAVILLDSARREMILEAFRAGARGIFVRHESLEVLAKCVHRVHEGQIWANSEQMAVAVEALASAPTVRAVNANGFSLLSKRELEVVRGLSEGLTNREIAERLGLSQHTIKNYLFRLFDKLGVSSRVELLFMTLSTAGAPQSTPQPLSGSRLENDVTANLSWYEAAAEQGLPSAQAALAEMYRDGQRVARDPVAAYMWYLVSERASAELRDKVAAARKDLEASLTPDQILQARRLAFEHLEKAANARSPRSPSLNMNRSTLEVV